MSKFHKLKLKRVSNIGNMFSPNITKFELEFEDDASDKPVLMYSNVLQQKVPLKSTIKWEMTDYYKYRKQGEEVTNYYNQINFIEGNSPTGGRKTIKRKTKLSKTRKSTSRKTSS